MTTFDRYLLKRYWHVYIIAFLALFGLYVIIDAFSNADDFLDREGTAFQVMLEMAEFYAYRASMFFDMIGSTVSVMAAMASFSLVLRYGELNPVLAAGIPTYRLMIPLLWGTLFINGAMVVNQELVIPRIASQLQIGAGSDAMVYSVEPVYDFATQILIAGQRMHLHEQKMEVAEFVLPVPLIADELTTIKAPAAVYEQRPANSGWRIMGVPTPYEDLKLTPRGREVVRPGARPDELFVVTDVSFDRLYRRDKNFEYLTTWELMRRIRSPSFGAVSIRSQSLHLHVRLTRPIMSLIAVLLGVPLIARKDSRGLVGNLAISAVAMGLAFGTSQAFFFLGKANVVSPDLAAWGPIIICGTASAWISGFVRT